jgi:hypothetical protein
MTPMRSPRHFTLITTALAALLAASVLGCSSPSGTGTSKGTPASKAPDGGTGKPKGAERDPG